MNVEKPFQCTECDFRFTTNAAKKIHMSKHHGKVKASCPLCGKVFGDSELLRKHRLNGCNVINSEGTACSICGDKFYKPLEREKHMQETHFISDPRCFNCSYKPVDYSDLKEHLKTHKNKPGRKLDRKYFGCTKCDVTCNTKSLLMHHMKSHNVASLACTKCNFVAQAARGLKIHEISVHKSKKIKRAKECRDEIYSFVNKCDKNMLDNSENDVVPNDTIVVDLEWNIDNDDGEELTVVESKTIRCMECSYIAQNEQDLTKHIENHIMNAMFKI